MPRKNPRPKAKKEAKKKKQRPSSVARPRTLLPTSSSAALMALAILDAGGLNR